jgi:hypothetical protein
MVMMACARRKKEVELWDVLILGLVARIHMYVDTFERANERGVGAKIYDVTQIWT